jgi:hypothetical protein
VQNIEKEDLFGKLVYEISIEIYTVVLQTHVSVQILITLFCVLFAKSVLNVKRL